MAAISPALELLDRQLALHSHVAGDDFTLADIPTGAACYRWKLFALEGPATPNLDAWLARLARRTGFLRHVQPREHHL